MVQNVRNITQKHCRGTPMPCAPRMANHTSADFGHAQFSGTPGTHTLCESSSRAALRTVRHAPWHPHALSQSRSGSCSRSRLRPMAYGSELRVRAEFEQAGIGVCRRLQGCQVQQKEQRNGRAREGEDMSSRLAEPVRHARRGLPGHGQFSPVQAGPVPGPPPWSSA